MRATVIVMAAAVLAGAAGRAGACSCIPPKFEYAREKAAAIFVGKVDEIDQTPGPVPQEIVTLAVQRAWKGVWRKSITIQTTASSAACGYPFKKGERYLVFANERGGSLLHTWLCSRTKPVGEAGEALEKLGPGKPPEQMPAIDANMQVTGGVYVKGKPVVLRFTYSGGIEGWDGAIQYDSEHQTVELINGAFLRIDRGGHPIELDQTKVQFQRKVNERFELYLPLSKIADLSRTGRYRVRWGVEGLAEQQSTFEIIDPAQISKERSDDPPSPR